MSSLHNIKKTCASTTNLIKNILNIKDKHITFPDYAYAFSNEKIHACFLKSFLVCFPTLKIPIVVLLVESQVRLLSIRLKLVWFKWFLIKMCRPTCVYTSNVIVVKRADKRFPLRQTSLMNVAIFQTHWNSPSYMIWNKNVQWRISPSAILSRLNQLNES